MRKKIAWILTLALLLLAATCPPKPPTQKIQVLICNSFPDLPATEARIVNAYCPSSHFAEYVKGHEPVTTCTLHVKPEPPIPVCDIPWPETHKLLIWEGTLLSFLSTKENEEFTWADMVAYADALAQDGTNCIRSFSFFLDDVYRDGKEYWVSWKPADAEYRDIIQARLKLLVDRKITTIVSLEPYGGMATDSELEWIIETCKPFLPYVIFETCNESGDMDLHRRLIAMLKAKGIPNKNIMLYYCDSGDFADCLVNELNGEGLASLHGVGSVETIFAPWPKGWATSDGTLALCKLGLFPSSDGEDAEHKALGSFWHWLPDPEPGRRPSADQAYEITSWALKNSRGWEFLSAAGFLESDRPNLKKAIELGRPERKAMRAAYNEVVH
jgi:hypothetical protein